MRIASRVNSTVSPRHTASASGLKRSYKAKRTSSTAWVNGFTAHSQYSHWLASRIFHNGYSAEDRKNSGKITKFITPAKFSSWRIAFDSNSPRALSISATSNNAGSASNKPVAGGFTPYNQAMARKAYTCSREINEVASSLLPSRKGRGNGLVSNTRMLPISRS
ncbi:hypothetical protein D3C75_844670 [compost metagenome]